MNTDTLMLGMQGKTTNPKLKDNWKGMASSRQESNMLTKSNAQNAISDSIKKEEEKKRYEQRMGNNPMNKGAWSVRG